MASRLRIGIVGLGRRWTRYRHALAALADEVRAVALCDPSATRASEEARTLGCEVAGGIVELLERPDVQAVLVPGGAWYGLWPVEQACKAGKPVLCALTPVEDEDHVDALRAHLGAEARVHVALWPTLNLLREALGEKMQQGLGRASLLQASWSRQGANVAETDVLSSRAVLALLRACADLLGSSPISILAQQSPRQPGFASLLVEFPHAQVASLTLWNGPAIESSCRLHVEAENGTVRAELPRLLEWLDGQGRHSHLLPGGMAEVLTLDRFRQALRHDDPPECSLEDACRALDWLRAARRSRAEGKRVDLGRS